MPSATIFQFPTKQPATTSRTTPPETITPVHEVAEAALAKTAEMHNELALFRGDLREILKQAPASKKALENRIYAMREIAADAETALTFAIQALQQVPSPEAV